MQEKNMGHICPIGRSGVKLFPLRILYKKKKFFLKLLKILEIYESRLNSSVRSFEIWYWRFQGISIKRVIFSRSPGAKLHQYRLNCRHTYVDLMAIETMKSFICFDSIDYLIFTKNLNYF